MAPGKLIVFSGGEGSGKTTVLQYVATQFPEALATKSPGGTSAGMQIRNILLNQPDITLAPMTELSMFFADMTETAAQHTRPALAKGQSVLCDRYWMETYAYEWVASLDRHDVETYMQLVKILELPKPDLWLWFDV